VAPEGDEIAAQEEGPLPGTGTPDQTGRVGAVGGTPAHAGRGQRWLARLAFAAGTAAVLVLVLAGALPSITALLLGLAGLAIACAAAWWFLAHRGTLRWLAGRLISQPFYVEAAGDRIRDLAGQRVASPAAEVVAGYPLNSSPVLMFGYSAMLFW
jgi:hypothetical protein